MSTDKVEKFKGFQAVVAQKARDKFLAAKISDPITLAQVKTFNAGALDAYAKTLSQIAQGHLKSYGELTSIAKVSTAMTVLFWVFTVLSFGAFYFIINAGVNGVLNDEKNSKKIVDDLAVVAGISNIVALDAVLNTFFELDSPPPSAVDGKTKADEPAPSSILAALMAGKLFLDASADISDPAKLLNLINAMGVKAKDKAGAPKEFNTEQREQLKQLVSLTAYTKERNALARVEKVLPETLHKVLLAYGAIQLQEKNANLFEHTHEDFLLKSFLDNQKFAKNASLAKALQDPMFVGVITKPDGGPIGAIEFDSLYNDIAENVKNFLDEDFQKSLDSVFNVQRGEKVSKVVEILKGFGIVCAVASDIAEDAEIPAANFSAVTVAIAEIKEIFQGVSDGLWTAIEANDDYKAAIEAEQKTPLFEPHKTLLDAMETQRKIVAKAETALFPPIASTVATPKAADAKGKTDPAAK